MDPSPATEGSWAAFWSLVVAAWAALLTAFGIHVKSARDFRNKENERAHAEMAKHWAHLDDKVDKLVERVAKLEGIEGR